MSDEAKTAAAGSDNPLVINPNRMAGLPVVNPFYYSHLKIGNPYSDDTYQGRVQSFFEGLHPRYLFARKERIADARDLLQRQDDWERTGKGEAPKETAAEMEAAWRINRWCTDTQGERLPFYGRMAFHSPVLIFANLAHLWTMSNMTSFQQRSFVFSRLAAQSTFFVPTAVLALHGSGTRTGADNLQVAVTYTVGAGLGVGLASVGEWMSIQERLRGMKDAGLVKYLREFRLNLKGNGLLGVGVLVTVALSKAQEWCPTFVREAHLDVYDKHGELVAKSSSAGLMAARETAGNRALLAGGSGMLGTFLAFRLPDKRLGRFHNASVCAMYAALYIVTLPFFFALSPTYTSVASRRIDTELPKAGIPVVYYWRGL
eukprot:Rhum_TRINITY_DN23061_c0_g1::Rhum_TRINITY_DN23061_c0_g1_i1::g.177003::m.177003